MPRQLLVVDDIFTNREILKKILKNEYEILEAANGAEAMDILRETYRTLSAVLLDLAMPVMNGFEVLSRMRQDAELVHIPVIVTTGQTEIESEVKALSLGAHDYITKPYNSTIIKQRIRNTINLRETAATVNALQRDKLTGLYNREVFFEKAAEMIASAAPRYYVMASFNIDGFKIINDQYGSEMGDRVLQHVARCIDRFVSPRGGLCCRVMADNFAVLYPSRLADSDEMRENHRETTAPAGLNRPISIRIGRYLVTDPTLSASAMYDRASLAEASVHGRYDVYIGQYTENMRTRILLEQEIVNEMDDALTGGQFEVWFQPQINHANGALIGAEGLVRWRHPQKGLISPAQFIPVFERNGFIYELDKFVWERACACLRGWLDAGLAPLPLSVNVSRYDLFRDDLIDTITQLTARYSIPPDMLRFEITESAFAESPEQIIRVVESLVAKGYTVEIDDFGSGYSSLNTLKDVPADILKLDMRFLEGSRNTERGGNILESVIRMAKWLGMPVIAEGVETIEQADYLKSIGCCYIQGYLYARPMPIPEYEVFASRFRQERKLPTLETAKNLNNNTFWDPRSMDTLIFNSYVGGACIFEYQNGKVELLRVNENYSRELGGDTPGVPDPYQMDFLGCMDAENRRVLMDNITNAIATDAESSCEVVLTGLRGPGAHTYIRTTVRVIAASGTRYLLYCAIVNLTGLRESEKKEREASALMLLMMNDMPGGFCRIRSRRGAPPALVYVNDGLCRILGMTQAEVLGAYGENAFGPIHPEDFSAVSAVAAQALADSRQFSIRLRLRGKANRVVPVLLFGRPVRTDSGEWYLNAYFSDITEQLGIEALQKDLLDHLPCGAALYRFADGALTVSQLNRRYEELVGRNIVDNPQKTSVIEAVHPDDRDMLFSEIRQAIAQRRDILCRIRLRYGQSEDEYRVFRVFGNAVRNQDDSYSIYGLFLPLSHEEYASGRLLGAIPNGSENSDKSH